MNITLMGMCKALANLSRLRIIRALAESDLCVCELADALDIRQTAMSNHLAKMRALGIVGTRRDGTWVYYRIAPGASEAVSKLLQVFEDELNRDTVIARDLERLRSRLAMRVNGKCKRSYGQL